MNDNRKQLRMLHHLARSKRYRNINLWAKEDMADFLSASVSWRMLKEGIL